MSPRSRLGILGMLALVAGQPLFARDCDILLGPAELEADLDQVLGSWSALAAERHVSIDPGNAACYVQIRIVVNAPLGADCVLDACSVAIFKEQNIGLQAFEVHGCDALLSVLAVSRHVPTALTDASKQIATHCGSDRFEFSSAHPVMVNGHPRVRVQLREIVPAGSKRP